MEQWIYITKNGDTWDKIANECYGNPFLIADIINANPNLEIKQVFDQDEIVYVPIKENISTLDDSFLPPWKRSNL